MVIDGNQADFGIRIQNSDNYYFRIENCTIYNCKTGGIYFTSVKNGTIINCNVSNNDDGVPTNNEGNGIWTSASDNNTIINNILFNNSEYGIYMGTSDDNIIQGNIIKNNSRHGVAFVTNSYRNEIINNHIVNNSYFGLTSSNGYDHIIRGNVISDNGNDGLRFYGGNGINITENIIRRNQNGVEIEWTSTGFVIYKNYFIGNTLHANDDVGGNEFHSSSVGNYWDNYTGNDNSPYDGIGDTPYNFIGGGMGAVDNYPILELPYFTGEKIHIDETRTNAINWTRAAYLKDYITGSGIISDPYIIQDLTINANDSGNCISIENSDVYFKIENCTLSNSSSAGAAIRFDEVNNSIIIDNKITKNNGDGIWFFFNCWYNTIINNTINESSDHGIYITATAKYNEILNNKIHNNTGNSKYGIYLNNGAYYNNISNNHIYNNTGSSRSAIAVRSSSSWNNITNNIIEQNDGNGIYLYLNSIHNRVFQNTILNNTEDGILVLAPDGTGCDDNNITENEIKYNSQNGITLSGSPIVNFLRRIYVSDNNISYNTQNGIHFRNWADDILITNNNISYNGPSGLFHGIHIDDLHSNINITNNLISNHSGIGILIDNGGQDCLIYNNTFRSNFIHAQDNRIAAPYNQWNSTDTGNYWDNYTDMGVGALDMDDNGRGDIPYNISGTANSQDHFPLWEDGDDMPPYITVNSPTNDTTWASAPLIGVSVSDQNLAYIWYNVTGNPTIEFLINNVGENLNDSLWAGLPQGQFEITFFANDTFGKTSNLTLTYLKDSKPPEIVFNIVLDDSYWNKEPLINITTFDVHPGDIWYNVSGNSTIFFITNNSQSQLDSYIWANFGEGVFQISFFANDSLSNLNNTVIISLTKDTIKPLVSIDRIIEHGHEPPEFELTIFDINIESRWYTLDNGITNKSFFSSTGTIAQDIWDSADVGDLTIIFYARDFAGNIFSQAISITKEEAPLGEEPPDLMMIIIIVVGIVAGVLTIGIVMVKRSKKEVREIEAEIKTLKEQREEITEDDILISKEKHICLVHKGAVGGMSYICPECGAYYCMKCYDVVKKAENECWSCNTPLDPSLVSKKKKGIAKKEKKEDIEIEFGEEPEEIKHKDIEHKAIKPKGLTPLPEHPKEKQELTIRATPVKEDIETKQKELVTEQKIKPQPEESIIPEEKQTLTGAEAVKKFDDYIEQLNVMVQKLDIKFSAGVITQEQYLEKKTMLAEKLGEATAKRDQLKE